MKDKKSKLEEIETSHTLGKDCRIWIVEARMSVMFQDSPRMRQLSDVIGDIATVTEREHDTSRGSDTHKVSGRLTETHRYNGVASVLQLVVLCVMLQISGDLDDAQCCVFRNLD